MNPKFLPFKENTILTGPGEAFPIPLAYKGWALYFGSLEHVRVPEPLQVFVAYELNTLFESKQFAKSTKGNTEVGIVTVIDGDKKHDFEVTITLVETGRDDFYSVDSILEVSK